MKTRMGKNVDLVRLLAKASRKVVAAATGVVKDWYSSVWKYDELWTQKEENARGLTCRNSNIIDRIAVPKSTTGFVEGKVGEDEIRNQFLEVGL